MQPYACMHSAELDTKGGKLKTSDHVLTSLNSHSIRIDNNEILYYCLTAAYVNCIICVRKSIELVSMEVFNRLYKLHINTFMQNLMLINTLK